jgi:cytosine/adenosine deaminase-related metal-dependent hydrolase
VLFKNATVITMDPKRRIITGGAVAVRGSRIEAVGKSRDLGRKFSGDETIDLRGGLLMPGLIDSHVHLAQAMLRGCAENLSHDPWLTERVWPLEGSYEGGDGRISAELCILEMLKSGTTTFLETFLAAQYGIDAILQVIRDSGIRSCVSKLIMDVPSLAGEENAMFHGMREDLQSTLRQAREMHAKWDGAEDGRIRIWLGPRGPGGSSEEGLRTVVKVARELDTGINIHFCEIEEQRVFIRDTYGCSPTELMERIGMVGKNVLLIHAVWVDPEDIERIATTGTHVVHNPSANTKMGSGIARIPDMILAGVNVVLGCDGGPSNNTHDMIREMRIGSYIHKGVHRDASIMPAETMLEMATINGAKMLGAEEEIGSIEPGKRADLTAVDMRRPHLVPAPDPVGTLVASANGSDVSHVMVDGRLLVRRGKVLTMDENGILKRVAKAARELYARTDVKIPIAWPVE